MARKARRRLAVALTRLVLPWDLAPPPAFLGNVEPLYGGVDIDVGEAPQGNAPFAPTYDVTQQDPLTPRFAGEAFQACHQ